MFCRRSGGRFARDFNDALMRLADYLERYNDDTYLKVYSWVRFWDNDAYA